MNQEITVENANEILKKTDEKIAIFAGGYLMGKTRQKWDIKINRSYLDLLVQCSIGKHSISTGCLWFNKTNIIEVIVTRLDEVIDEWEHRKENEKSRNQMV